MRKRVLIVDDHEMVRRSLTLGLSLVDDMQVVGTASNGLEALAQCALLRPDVVLLDMNMPGINGLETTRRLRQQQPNIAVIILTVDTGLGRAARAAGAAACLSKLVPLDEIARHLREATEASV